MRTNDKIDYNEVTYEKLHKCSKCGGDLRLTAKSSSYQMFVCCECKKRFELKLIDNSVEVIGEAIRSNSVVRSPYSLKHSTGAQ